MTNVQTIYHVAVDGWDGGDLLSLARRLADDLDAMDAHVAARWPEHDPAVYRLQEAEEIHCHTTLAEAEEYAEEYGGDVLAIDASELRIGDGREYPHPIIMDRIAAELVSRAKGK